MGGMAGRCRLQRKSPACVVGAPKRDLSRRASSRRRRDLRLGDVTRQRASSRWPAFAPLRPGDFALAYLPILEGVSACGRKIAQPCAGPPGKEPAPSRTLPACPTLDGAASLRKGDVEKNFGRRRRHSPFCRVVADVGAQSGSVQSCRDQSTRGQRNHGDTTTRIPQRSSQRNGKCLPR